MNEKLGMMKKEPAFLGMRAKLFEAEASQVNLTGLSPIHQAFFIAEFYKSNRGAALFVLAESEAMATRITSDINMFLGEGLAVSFGERDYLFRDMEKSSREYEWDRIRTLSMLQNGSAKIVVASAAGASQYTVCKEELSQHTLALKVGESHDLKGLTEILVRAGYTRREQVSGIAEFSVRGGIVDIFPVSVELPVRIEFWGDEIDSIHSFRPDEQRREESLTEISITPADEMIVSDKSALAKAIREKLAAVKGKLKETIMAHTGADLERLEAGESVRAIDKYIPLLQKETIFDYMGEDSVFFYLDLANMREIMQSRETLHNEDLKQLFTEGILFRGLEDYYKPFAYFTEESRAHKTAYLDVFARTSEGIRLDALLSAQVLTLSVWSGEYKVLKEDLREYFSKKYAVVLYAGTEKTAENLKIELRESGFVVAESFETGMKAGQVLVLAGTLSSGAEYPGEKLAVLTYARVQSKKKKRRRKKAGEMIRSVADISVGDYIVHVSHGIGVFEGIHKIESEGLVKDYIKIRYAGKDVLYVPVTQLDLVSKYIGPKENSNLRLNTLNTNTWEKTRARVKLAASDMAKELIALYAKRLQTKGFSFPVDTVWQQEFEGRFPYEETDDQLRSVEEIKADMEREQPMDRLLCGDVGFGKTEVALRAAFKCVMGNKQCALLAPTTILAWQHYQTMKVRFSDYPIEIGHLSRFNTPKQRAETLKKMRTGELDLVVGTHSLVQKSAVFHDLGLAIIDEEQRFGVKHKEAFKDRTASVDVLSLSATPIPRTLNMAMSGIRDMSVLEEAPGDRQPIQTYVLEYSDHVLHEAIAKELRRDGQVYYLYNRIDDMDRVVGKLLAAFPEARIAAAHGRMGEEELSDVWGRLNDNEIDILVCTTIIETGVDIANCNTLIIEDADKMGLAQLYQIRGRVGRSTRRAYAYFTFRRGKVMTEVAAKRLTAIKEFTNFGSGFQIAMRDLEIRGAGSILGGSQHGHMESVGYDLYIKILSEAIAEEKGEPVQEDKAECLVDIRVDAHIPESYIIGVTQRIDIYKRIAAIESEEDSTDVIDELIDRYGEPPKAVEGLIQVALIRNRAAKLGMTEISEKSKDNVILYLNEHIRFEEVSNLIREMKGRALFNAGGRPYLSVRKVKGQKVTALLEEVLMLMEGEDVPKFGNMEIKNS